MGSEVGFEVMYVGAAVVVKSVGLVVGDCVGDNDGAAVGYSDG